MLKLMYCLYCLNFDIVWDFDFEIMVLKKRKLYGIYKEIMNILWNFDDFGIYK